MFLFLNLLSFLSFDLHWGQLQFGKGIAQAEEVPKKTISIKAWEVLGFELKVLDPTFLLQNTLAPILQ